MTRTSTKIKCHVIFCSIFQLTVMSMKLLKPHALTYRVTQSINSIVYPMTFY